MGLSGIMQWWEEWQLRVLVLGSLVIQIFLYFSDMVRRFPTLRKLRVLVWIAYIGGDAVAIYALATLFNRQKETWGGESTALEVLWAPVILTHLGGQPFISAYSLEDNELWIRHTITLVSQVMVALYVFCKWWSGEKRLLVAAILLFVGGILRFAHKPWALKKASFTCMQVSYGTHLQWGHKEEEMCSLKEYLEEAKECVRDTKVDDQHEMIGLVQHMVLDLSVPYFVRVVYLTIYLKYKYEDAYDMLQNCLREAFYMLYTRFGSIEDEGVGFYLLLLPPFLDLASMVIFATSRKDGHSEKDIMVTYILLCCTTMLGFFPHCGLFFGSMPYGGWILEQHMEVWHGMVSQCNLISFCIRKKMPTFLMKLATFKCLSEYVNQHWYIQQVHIAYQITGLVRQHVVDGWGLIDDPASYRRFNERRGQGAISSHPQLQLSLKMPFDDTILIWHVATDLCFYHLDTSPECRRGEDTQRGREISNYMIYLLFIRPEMLMPGTRSGLFASASDEIVRNSKGPLYTEELVAQEILNMPILQPEDGIITRARELAEELMKLSSNERWKVIQGVWVEMLCYSASRCRGYLHAKSLGEGGEYLSTVWLLWQFMGMETLSDRHQRSDLQEEAGGGVAAAQGISRSQGRTSEVEEEEIGEAGGEGTSRSHGRASEVKVDILP